MVLAYICFVFNISIVFEDFLGSVFCLFASITSRIYYTKEIKELHDIPEKTEIVQKKIKQTTRVSFVAPLTLALPAIALLWYGVFK